jgi:Carboxypeptidase regulatory-like domain
MKTNTLTYFRLEGSMKSQSLLKSRFVFALTGLFVLLLFSSVAMAQDSSTIRGTVKDPQGNVVAGANVTLTNPSTNAVRTTTTRESGAYSFDIVEPGDYRLEVEAKGFKKSVITDVHALVAKPTAVDVQMEIGNVSESVTIASGAAELLVNRDDATLGNNFVNQQITQLPLSARNVITLLTLQPGVTRGGSVTGARSDQSNVTLDGVDINEAQTNSIGAAQDNATTSQMPDSNTVLRLNSEAIEEFRVTTANSNATQGRSSGAQVSIVSKSGSNDWHGSAYEFYRSKGLSANDFFNNRSGVPKPQLIRHAFNGSVEGPIIKDRVFFFYSFDARRQLSQSSVVRTVPLASMGQGQLRYFGCDAGVATCTSANATIQTRTTAQLNALFPAVGMNPAAIAVLAQAAAKYPANDFTTGDSQAGRLLNTAGFRFNAPTPVQLSQHWATFSFNISKNQTLSVRTIVQYDKTTLTPAFPDTPRPGVWSHPWGTAVSHTWTMNDHMVNTFHYGYTREAFTSQGDSSANAISFRFVFSPLNFSRTLSRETPVQNFVDDLTWTKGNHTLGFGVNLRIVRNTNINFGSAFDNAIANPSFYSGGAGATLSNPINTTANGRIAGSASAVQNAMSALIGRLSQYTADFTFDHDGSLFAAGVPTKRTFATEGYDGYVQDVWKMRSNLTITAGLRYSLEHPVYETQGFELKSDIPLSDYFAQRLAGAAKGVPFNTPIHFAPSGKANHAGPLYDWDKNNFQPRVAVAWTPRFSSGFLGKIFGTKEQSVFRGGFSITNDQYGEQLAVNFDLANATGFVSNFTTSANTFCTTNPACAAPLFTGFGQAVRPLPGVVVPGKLTFPTNQPADNSRRIETSFDSKLTAPINYSWNFTFERQLPKGLVLQAAYVGRHANHLIATRDVMALNNLKDPKSGMDWYTAAGMLEIMRTQGVPVSAVAQIPYFANLFPSNLAALVNQNYCGGTCIPTTTNGQPTTATQAVYYMAAADFFGNDWTDTQDGLDTAISGNLFFNPQYGALSAYSSVARSWYNAGTISLRERLGKALTFDFNYTLSHSLDDASGVQNGGGFGALFIENPIDQRQSYANSDFDIRHIININAIWEMPFGRGRKFFSNSGKAVNAVLGGWQLASIYRWNSGAPADTPFDDARWATNWNAQSNAIRAKSIESCPDRGGLVAPKLFGCDPTGIYQSFRNARPGESGDRNVFRLPGYVALDMGLSKEFTMPWSEKHKLQVRFEAFNVTNTQRMGTLDLSRTGLGITLDPSTGATPPTNWSNFTGIQGQPREMQFGFRYTF